MKRPRKQIFAIWCLASGCLFAILIFLTPQLRFVDFVAFSDRAQRISNGDDLYHGLYPIGYPVALLLGKVGFGSVLLVGKFYSVVGSIVLLFVAIFWQGNAGALAVVSCASFWLWGQVEGTDMVAAGLTIGAVVLARDKPGWASVLWCVAFLTRYTAIAGLPFVIWASPHRLRTLVYIVIGTSPHWFLALWVGQAPLIDQTENFSRSPEPIHVRLLWGPIRGIESIFRSDPWLLIAVLGWVKGLKDTIGRRVFAFGLVHLVMISLVFTKPRLLLPLSIVFSLGWIWFVFRKRYLWTVSVVASIWGIYRSVDISPRTLEANHVAFHSPVSERFLTTSPWFFYHSDGWLRGGVPLGEVSRPDQLSTSKILQYAKRNDYHYLVVNSPRLRAPYKRLRTILEDQEFTLVYQYGMWKVYKIP